jgi:hemolysin-activating ACP:hemolysin acyltransferase
MQDIISLYRNYNHYNHLTDEDLETYLQPSINLNQYKKHYKDNNLIGFTNWAYLSDNDSENFKNTGDIINWNSGNNLWHIETICISNLKNIISWTKNNLTKKFGVGRSINWLRTDQKQIYKYLKIKTKDNWLWAV